MKFLHLLNGDSTLHQFKQTEIRGDCLVWREILCEGETIEKMGSPLFWEKRAAFLRYFSPPSFDKHFEKNKKAFSEVNLSEYEEVVLWFEYDLFCQINMLGLLSWINDQDLPKTKIALVCLGHHPKYEKLVGLGEIEPTEYYQLLEERTELEKEDLAYAARVWKAYCSADHSNLLHFIEPERAEKFPYLEEALRWHQKRIPDPANGLDEIESFIVQMLAKQPLEKRSIVGALLQRENFYGFGDIQYFKYLQDMEAILKEIEGKVALNATGQEVLAGQRRFAELRNVERRYGGICID